MFITNSLVNLIVVHQLKHVSDPVLNRNVPVFHFDESHICIIKDLSSGKSKLFKGRCSQDLLAASPKQELAEHKELRPLELKVY